MHPRFPDFDYKDPAALLARLKKLLPPEHWLAFETVSNLAQAEGQTVYLVGGIVRDLILGRPNFDLDFVCLNDARWLARQLVSYFEALPHIGAVRLTEHPAFKTARLNLIFSSQPPTSNLQPPTPALHVDLATARHEIYTHPAALPTVTPEPATLEEDLRRRDFTINAMALSFEKGLVDPFNGLDDLRDGLIRVLHAKSFEDDPTRMTRGIRFAARFGYRFEPQTERLLETAIAQNFFSLLSAERKRNELRLILSEIRPEKALNLLEKYHLLQAIHPFLTWNEALQDSFRQLREYLPHGMRPVLVNYLAALLHLTDPKQVEVIVNDLRFAGIEATIPLTVARLWKKVRPRLVSGLKNSQLYALLNPYSTPILAIFSFEALLREPEPEKASQVEHYRKYLANLHPQTSGDFLIKTLGLKPGPHFKIWLAELRDAVLNGEVQGKAQEEAFLRRITPE